MVGGARVQVRRSVWIHRGQHCHNSKPRPGRYAGAAVGGRWGEGAGTQERQRVVGVARVQVRRSVWIHMGQHCHNSKPSPGQVRRGGSGWSVGRGCRYVGACGYIGGNIVIIPSTARAGTQERAGT